MTGPQIDSIVFREFGGARLQPPTFAHLAFMRLELASNQKRLYSVAALGVHFDLPPPLSRVRRVVSTAAAEAATVFEACFDRSDTVALDAYVWNQRSIEQITETLSPSAVVEVNAGMNYRGDLDDATPYTRLTTAMVAGGFESDKLFRLIAATDFGSRRSIDAVVYLINVTNPLIQYMYDDRGLLLYASTLSRFPSSVGVRVIDRGAPACHE